MFGVTPRQRAAASVVLLTGLVAATAAVLGLWRAAGAAAALMLTATALVLLDLRRRQGELMRRVHDGVHRVEDLHREHRRQARTGSTNIDLAASIQAVQSELRSAVEAIPVQDLFGRVAEVDAELRRHLGGVTDFRTDVTGLIRDQTREVEALFQLFGMLEPHEPMPPSGRWALNPQGLLNLCALARRHRPQVVVELGSGTSTIWLGYALADTEPGRLISLDHDLGYAERTRTAVQLHRAWTAPTEVRYASLVPLELGSEQYEWYDRAHLADVERIDLLVVDGPPGRTGRDARYPALPVLADRLADGARIVLDDVDRSDEQRIVARWLDQFPDLSQEPTIVGDQAVFRWSPGRVSEVAGTSPAEG